MILDIFKNFTAGEVSIIALVSIFVAINLVDRVKAYFNNNNINLYTELIKDLSARISTLEDRISKDINELRCEITNLREQFGRLNGSVSTHLKLSSKN